VSLCAAPRLRKSMARIRESAEKQHPSASVLNRKTIIRNIKRIFIIIIMEVLITLIKTFHTEMIIKLTIITVLTISMINIIKFLIQVNSTMETKHLISLTFRILHIWVTQFKTCMVTILIKTLECIPLKTLLIKYHSSK
jgi:hypothetical protein